MKKILIAAILFVSIFGIALNDAHAYSLLGGKHKTKNLTYRINTLDSSYHSTLKSAFSAWDSATSLTFRPQVGTNRAQIVINGSNYGKTGWNAQNQNYRDLIIAGNYVDSIISANYYYMKGMNSFRRQGVFGHEIGHSLGLGHVTNTSQIMSTDAGGRSVNKPGSDDRNGIKALYK